MSDPITLYSTAKGYVQSAHLIMSNGHRMQVPDDTSFYMSFHLLCGFAVELYLKAFLTQHGANEKHLRSVSLRHNLEGLYTDAKACGLQSRKIERLIDLLAKLHKEFSFRYMERDAEYAAINLVVIFAAFSELDHEVDAAVGASASLKRPPGRDWVFPPDASAWRLGPITGPKL